MSSGDVLILPVAAVALVPAVALGAIVGIGYGVKKATEAAVEAYFRSRLEAEERRASELQTIARRLRVAGVDVPGGPAGGVADLRARVQTLTARNQEADQRLRDEQATLNGLDVERSALSAQDRTQRRWCEESGIRDLPHPPTSQPDASAVEEAQHQVAMLKSAALSMKAALAHARGDIDADQARTVFERMIELPGGAAPEPSWRKELRNRMRDAVVDLRLDGSLPGEFREAASLVETSEDQAQVTERVDAALAELRRLHRVAVTEENFRNRVHHVMAQAEAIEHYGIAELCRDALGQVAAKAAGAGDGSAFSTWARATAQSLEERMLESLQARAQADESVALQLQELAAHRLKEAMCAALMATDSYVEVPMETVLPHGGRLLIERAPGSQSHTGYAKVVEVRDGTVSSRTVRLSQLATPAEDTAACARQTGRDRDLVEPVLRESLAEKVDQDSINWDHQDEVAVSWQPLSEGDHNAVTAAVKPVGATAKERHLKERS